MSVAVYTAVAGRYDPLRPAPPIRGVDFIAFVDDVEKYRESGGWELRPLPERDWHPRLRAKEPKCLPHLFLPEYEETIWIDASHQIRNRRFAQEMIDVAMAGELPFAVHKHPWRDCIYDEAVASLELAKYQVPEVAASIEREIKVARDGKHPEHWGLWALGSIARLRDPLVDAITERWWKRSQACIQDQLSFPVVMRTFSQRPTIFPHHQVFNNPWFRIHEHPRNDE